MLLPSEKIREKINKKGRETKLNRNVVYMLLLIWEIIIKNQT
jgi:hypothetical protein